MEWDSEITWVGEVEEYGFPLPDSLRAKFDGLGEAPEGSEWVACFNWDGGRGGLCFQASWDRLLDFTGGWEEDDHIYLSWGHGPLGCVERLPEHEGF